MNNEWNNPGLAKAYAEKLDQIDWYEHDVNFPSLLSLIPKEARSILDFGSGPGQFTAKLAKDFRVVGADSSSAMVGIASESYSQISFLLWDGQTSFPADERFDVVFTKLTLHFVDDLAKFAQFSRRALLPGGCIVASVPHPIRTISKVNGKYSARDTYEGAIGKYDLHVQMVHRSFEDYIDPFLKNGFALTGLLEPKITEAQAEQHEAPEEDLYIPKRLNLRFSQV